MNKKEALEYCFKHRNQFIKDKFRAGENGTIEFNYLIIILKGGIINPNKLKDYGMNY